MSNAVKIGIIGLGARAETLLATMFALNGEVEVTAICDFRDARIDLIQSILEKHGWPKAAAYKTYRELIADPNVDAVLVPTSWNSPKTSPDFIKSPPESNIIHSENWCSHCVLGNIRSEGC